MLCDASVAIKWFYTRREPQLAEARAIARAGGRELTLRTLDLTHLEVANVLLRKKRVPHQRVDGVLARLRLIAGEPHRPTRREIRFAVLLAGRHGLSSYDALYWAVAQMLGTAFVTTDAELLAAGAGETPEALCARLGLEVSRG